jgi:superoxide dismutase, Cu-Zn family
MTPRDQRRKLLNLSTGIALASAVSVVCAQTLEVTMRTVSATGVGEPIGTIAITPSTAGVTFTPKLAGLPPGLHGFHIHEKPNCDPAMDPDKGEVMPAQSAGGHLDPARSAQHRGPMGGGHLGDLPALKVDSTGKATAPVVAPRLKMTDLAGHALMIHAGGDNYSDQPEKLGGGGKRIACGVIGS